MNHLVSPNKREILVFAFVMVGFAGIFYKPIFSYDIWLHLKMGEYIVEHDYALPKTDPFSYTTEGKPLILHEWLSQIVLYFVHNALGFSGLRIMRVFLELTALAFIFWAALQLSRRCLVALLVLLVTAYLFRTRYLIRPELFSLLFFTLFYTRFITARRRFSHVYYIVFFLLCIAWINLHPFMIFTGVIIAILCVARMATRIRGANRWFRVTELPFDPNTLFFLFLVASVINPYGHRIYGYVFGATPIVKQFIEEWQPIFINLQRGAFRSITGGVLAFPLIMKGLVIGIIVSFLTVLLGSYARKIRWTVEDMLMGLLMSYMAITAARFAWLLFVPVLLIVKYGILHTKNVRRSERLKLMMLTLLWGGVAISCLYWVSEGYCRIPDNFRHEIQIKNYPDIPVKILQETNLSGRLYNPAGWGGYLIYHLYPDYKVFIDTRTHLHGETSVVTSMMIQYQYPGFEKLIEKCDFDVLLFKKVFGDKRPFYSADWILIFENANSVMYLRNNDRNAMNLKKIVEYYKEKNLPFDPKKGFDLEGLRRDKDLSERYRLS